MSRRSKGDLKKPRLPDSLFSSELLGYVRNCIMTCGKKSLADSILYGALKIVWERACCADDAKAKQEARALDSIDLFKDVEKRAAALEKFEEALSIIKPAVEVKSTRVGGANYQVPREIPEERKRNLAVKWLILYARKRGEKTMTLRLAAEILDALNGRGGAVRKKEEVQKMAHANRAYA